jgi:hypothetical protein
VAVGLTGQDAQLRQPLSNRNVAANRKPLNQGYIRQIIGNGAIAASYDGIVPFRD